MTGWQATLAAVLLLAAVLVVALTHCSPEAPCPVPCGEECCPEGRRCEDGPPAVCVQRGLP